MKLFTILMWVGWSAWAVETAPKCPAPAKGSAWLQDFTEAQRKPLDVEWEADEKGETAAFRIKGTYPEPADQTAQYAKYVNESRIDATETWACNAQGAQFKSVSGKVRTHLKWKKKAEGATEKFDSESEFQIASLSDYRQVRQETDREIEVRRPTLRKDVEETVEWTQKWENDRPFAEGESRERTKEVHSPAVEPRVLASPILVPGFDPAPLESGVKLTIEKDVRGKFKGPLDPVQVVAKQVVQESRNDKPIEKKEIQSTQKTDYAYNAKAKKYEFVLMSEKYEETTINPEKGFKVQYARLDVWTDAEKPPTKSAFWKDSYRKTKFGATSELSVSSKGSGLLPRIFDFEPKDGSYSRITEFGSSGRVVRFLALFFPATGKQNTTLLDLHFGENGELKEFTTADAEINAIETPFESPKTLPLIQDRVNRLKDMERLAEIKELPGRTPREADYPVVQRPVP